MKQEGYVEPIPTSEEEFPSIYKSLEVRNGDIVKVSNTDDIRYQITGDGFGTGPVMPGESVFITFDRPGTWEFHDEFNSELAGQVTVL